MKKEAGSRPARRDVKMSKLTKYLKVPNLKKKNFVKILFGYFGQAKLNIALTITVFFMTVMLFSFVL